MNLPEARQIVEKATFDDDAKKRFLKYLDAQFLEAHKSFLSIPLLVLIMLLVIYQDGKIEGGLKSFYRSAFLALISWHDATKAGFERDRSLDHDQLKDVFSYFCLATYYKQLYEFDTDQLREYANKAKRFCHVGSSIDDIVLDLSEAANLIQKDGLLYIFSRRSFQEYFVADCLINAIRDKQEQFLDFFARRASHDITFRMAFDINRDVVISNFLLPHIAEIGGVDALTCGSNADTSFPDQLTICFGMLSELHGAYYDVDFRKFGSSLWLLDFLHGFFFPERRGLMHAILTEFEALMPARRRRHSVRRIDKPEVVQISLHGGSCDDSFHRMDEKELRPISPAEAEMERLLSRINGEVTPKVNALCAAVSKAVQQKINEVISELKSGNPS